MNSLAPVSRGTGLSGCEHIVGWFDHWLLGVAKPEYEVAPKGEVSAKPRPPSGKKP